MIKDIQLKNGDRIFADVLDYNKYNITVKTPIKLLWKETHYIVLPHYQDNNVSKVFDLNVSDIIKFRDTYPENIPYIKFLMRCSQPGKFMYLEEENLLLH